MQYLAVSRFCNHAVVWYTFSTIQASCFSCAPFLLLRLSMVTFHVLDIDQLYQIVSGKRWYSRASATWCASKVSLCDGGRDKEEMARAALKETEDGGRSGISSGCFVSIEKGKEGPG
jgi:hypothetical protein